MVRWLIDFVGVFIGTAFLQWASKRLPRSLVDNAMTGYIDNKIGAFFGVTESSVDGFLSEWIAPFFLAAGAVWLWHRWASNQLGKPSQKVSISTLIMIVCGIGFLSAAAYRFLGPQFTASTDRPPNVKNVSGPPIVWRFDKPTTIFWYARKPGDAVRIEAVVIHGSNISDFALKNVSGILSADMKTGEFFTARVNPHGTYLRPDDSAKLIPPRTTFDLMFNAGIGGGMSADDFLKQYGTLRFTFSYEENGNKNSFTEEFSFSYIEDQIAFIEEKTRKGL